MIPARNMAASAATRKNDIQAYMANPTQQSLDVTRKQSHPDCIGCSSENSSGLGLEFIVRDDRGVQAEFACSRIYQGYPGYLHGGISSLLLDLAMANCLFAHQKCGVTTRLIVRFLLPVAFVTIYFLFEGSGQIEVNHRFRSGTFDLGSARIFTGCFHKKAGLS
jgi:hypothetical protein